MDARSDRLLGRLAVLLSLMLIVIFAATAGRLGARRALEAVGWIAPSTTAYAVGESIDVPPDAYRASPITVILFARSSCPACEATQPFFRSIATLISGHVNARMVLSSPVAEGQNAAEIDYARAVGLDAQAVMPWGGVKPRVRNVPTLVVVNDHGVVLAAWEGVPHADDQKRITEFISTRIRAGR